MAAKQDQDWWRGGVIYQVYPRSFYDANGDGIGDLKGILTKLPYIAGLGVDAIWISPFFKSPMKDFGYDVSDYCDVDPIFGELDDFRCVAKKAHELGLKVVIDQVLSHTSDQHAWFQESRQSQKNEKSGWYVWADPKADGTPPNNWQSFFGGSAWTFDARRKQYYLHNFLSSQPDLNYHNPKVQEAVLNVLKFWLDLGVDGFRLDTVNMYFCDAQLRDNPVQDEGVTIAGMNDSNPRSYQKQVYAVNQPENAIFAERIRALMDQYPGSTTLGEIGSAEDPLSVMGEYTKGENRLHMCYTADLLGEEKSPHYIRAVMEEVNQRLPSSWPCWSLGNHDAMRFVTRWGAEVEDKVAFSKLMLAMLTSLRGSICLYQGEELGLPEADVSFEKLVDPFGVSFWPDYKGRDGCRTPMVWNQSKQGGFSTSEDTWLPVSPEHLPLAAETQVQDEDSVYNALGQFLAFRKEFPALSQGKIEFLDADEQLLAFKRSSDEQQVVAIFNMSDRAVEYCLDVDVSPLKGHGFNAQLDSQKVQLPAWQAFFGTA